MDEQRLVYPAKPRTSAAEASELTAPRGWFAIGQVDDLPRGTLQTHRIAGHEVVAFRGAAGVPAVLDAYCPHLGAHLGHGGRVDGDELRCPFHGFCFDRTGACTRTEYSSRVLPKARLRRWPVVERHGVLLVYYDPHGAPPAFEIPEVSMAGFAPFLFQHFRLRGHPQETTENSVDVGHFQYLHGYREVQTVAAAVMDGAHLQAHYSFFRPLGRLLGRTLGLRNVILVNAFGLGYSRIDVHEQQSGLRLRSLVLCSPRGGGEIDLRVAVALRDPRLDPEAAPWLRALAPLLLTRAARRALLTEYCHDIEQDFDIWRHKKHLPMPGLAVGDGPIGNFRKWARQFY